MGGEAALPTDTNNALSLCPRGVGLAETVTFGAFVVSPEHRFYGDSYGDSQPVAPNSEHASVAELQLQAYLSPDRALEDTDAVQLIRHVRHECSWDELPRRRLDSSHPEY
jgi:hypothetical protein